MPIQYFTPPPSGPVDLTDQERQDMLLSGDHMYAIFVQFYRDPSCWLIEHLRTGFLAKTDSKELDSDINSVLTFKDRTVDFLNRDWPAFETDCMGLVKILQESLDQVDLLKDHFTRFICKHRSRFEIAFLLESATFLWPHPMSTQMRDEWIGSKHFETRAFDALNEEDLFSTWLLEVLGVIWVFFTRETNTQEQGGKAGAADQEGLQSSVAQAPRRRRGDMPGSDDTTDLTQAS